MVGTAEKQSGQETAATSGATVVDAGGATVEVPDLGLLLRGSYTRLGSDLLVTGPDGGKLLLTGFFSQPTPPDLTAGGAVVTGDLAARLAGPAAPGQVAQAPGVASDAGAGADAIGTVTKVSGTVLAQRADGSRVELSSGDHVFRGDIVETAADGAVGITFADATEMSLGGDGRLVLDEMIYDPDSGSGESSFSLVSGAFSFVSGQIAKSGPDAMQVRTPVATIGIRGTRGVIKVGAFDTDGDGETDSQIEVALLDNGEIVIRALDGLTHTINQINTGFRLVGYSGGGLLGNQVQGASFVVTRDFFDSPVRTVLSHMPTSDDYDPAAAFQPDSPAPQLTPDLDPDGPLFDQSMVGNLIRVVLRPDELREAVGLPPLPPGSPQVDTVTFIDTPRPDGVVFADGPEGPGPVEDGDAGTDGAANAGSGTSSSGGTDTGAGHGTGTSTGTASGSGGGGATSDPAIVFTDVTLSFGATVSYAGSVQNLRVFGSGGADDVTTGSGHDYIIGGGGSDRIQTNAGNDTVIGGGGTDTVVGGSGRGYDVYWGGETDGTDDSAGDQLIYTSAVNGVTVNLEAGYAYGPDIDRDTIHGFEHVLTGAGDDHVFGNAAANSLASGDGADALSGGGGADTIHAGNGDDFVYGFDHDGADLLYGEVGTDTLLYTAVTQNLLIDLNAGLVTAQDGTEDTVWGFERAWGGSGDDTIIGRLADEYLEGGDGADSLRGGGGLDTLSGGAGNDTIALYGGEGLAFGGAGDDEIRTATLLGTTAIVGGDGTDRLVVGAGGEVSHLNGTSLTSIEVVEVDAGGQVRLNNANLSPTGNVTILGSGALVIDISVGDTWTHEGAVTVGGVAAHHYTFNGTTIYVADSLTFTPAADTSGPSFLSHTGSLSAAAATDDYSVTGTAGADTIQTGSGWDTVTGGGDADLIETGTGKDSVDGGAGNDIIHDDAGADTLTGGAGQDRIVAGERSGSDVVDGGDAAGAAVDLLDYTTIGSTAVVDLVGGRATGYHVGLDTISGFEDVFGSGASDLIVGGSEANLIRGNFGNDTIMSGAGADSLYGEAGDDVIHYGGGTVLVDGGSEYDRLVLTNGVGLTLTGAGQLAAVEEILMAGAQLSVSKAGIESSVPDSGIIMIEAEGTSGNGLYFSDPVNWSEGPGVQIEGVVYRTFSCGPVELRVAPNVPLLGTLPANGAVVPTLSAGADEWIGGSGADTVSGLAGADTLDGGTGGDSLSGGGGNDVLRGGAGTDTLSGGAGDDALFGDALNGPGDATDIADYGDDLSGVTVDLGTGLARGTASGNDTLFGIEIVLGGSGGDILTGGSRDETLEGADGDDILSDAFYSDDLLSGSGGNDTIVSFGYGDTISGGTGTDTLMLTDDFSGAMTGIETVVLGRADTFGTTTFGFSAAAFDANAPSGDVMRVYGGTGTQINLTDFASWSGGTVMYDGTDVFHLLTNGTRTLYVQAGVEILDNGSAVALPETLSGAYAVSDTATAAAHDIMLTAAGSVVLGAGDDTVIGSSGSDVISAGGGNDRVDAGLDNDTVALGAGGTVTVTGGGGTDLLDLTAIDGAIYDMGTGAIAGGVGGTATGFEDVRLGAGNDSITASAGVNTFHFDGRVGNDTIVGFASGGGDRIDLTGLGVHGVMLPGDVGYSATPTASKATVVLEGGVYKLLLPGGGSVTFQGLATQPLVTDFEYDGSLGVYSGSAGDDTIDATADLSQSTDSYDGNDLIVARGGEHTIDGGIGNDTLKVVYSDYDRGVTLSAATAGQLVEGGATTWVAGVESLHLVGSAHTDHITGGDGNDTLEGGRGDDTLVGGLGTDVARFDLSDLTVDVRNTVTGGATDQFAFQEFGWHTTWTHTLDGMEAVQIVSGSGHDELSGSGGDDTITGGAGDDTLSGADGNDLLTGGAGGDNIHGGIGADTVAYSGASARYTYWHANGQWHVRDALGAHGDGHDRLTDVEWLQFSDAIIQLAAAVTTGVTGAAASDTLTGTAGTEVVDGGAGDDSLYGGAGGADTIRGGLGDDTLMGGLGSDTLEGGLGADRYIVDVGLMYSGERDVIVDTGAGMPVGSANSVEIAGVIGSVAFERVGSDLVLHMTNGASVVISGQYANDGSRPVVNEFGFAEGPDFAVVPSDGMYTFALGDAAGGLLAGGNYVDLLVSGRGDDSMTGGGGNDWYMLDGNTYRGGAGMAMGTDTISDTAGSDTLVIAGADETAFFTRVGSDLRIDLPWLSSTTVANQFGGNAVEQVRFMTGSASGTVYTVSDGSTALGSSALVISDGTTAVGSDAFDIFFAAGGDTLTGGLGDDTFVLQRDAATTTITDFDAATDMLDLRQFFETGMITDGTTYAETATALTATRTAFSAHQGAGFIVVQDGADLEVWYTSDMSATSTDTSYQVARLAGVSAADFTASHLEDHVLAPS